MRLILCVKHHCEKDPYGNLCKIADFINSVRNDYNEETCDLRVVEAVFVGKYDEGKLKVQ